MEPLWSDRLLPAAVVDCLHRRARARASPNSVQNLLPNRRKTLHRAADFADFATNLAHGQFTLLSLPTIQCDLLLSFGRPRASREPPRPMLQGSQGQRTLSTLRGKDLRQELVAPAGDLAFPFDTVLRRMLL